MKQRKTALAAPEAGQGLVECAFIFSILLLLALAVSDFAFIYQTYIGVTNAANVGATHAANAPAFNTDQIQAAVLGEGSVRHCSSISVESTPPTVDSFGYDMVSVTVRCRLDDLLLIPESLHHLQLSSTVTRRVRP